MKAFLSRRKAALVFLLLAVIVIAYAAAELNALPNVYQRVLLPQAQTKDAEKNTASNPYLRDLLDKKTELDTALEGSCAPTSLYAVAQPASISVEKPQALSVSARLVGVDESYLELEPFSLYSGRYFYPDEYRYGGNVILLDEQLAVALFQYAEPILEEVRIGGKPYQIIGIVRDHKQVGDQMEYGAYVPYRSLIQSSVPMTAVVFEGKPLPGSGGWAAFTSATDALGETGTSWNLSKESMNAKMPLRVLLVLFGGAVAFFGIRVLNRFFARMTAAYRMRLRGAYARELLGWAALRFGGLVLGYAVCAVVLAQLFTVLLAPVFVFPEWVPAILVEPKDIAAAFWNVWQKPAAVVELRTPLTLRAMFFKTLMGWACGLAALTLGATWGALKEDAARLLPPAPEKFD